MSEYIPGELSYHGQGYESWYGGRQKSYDDYNSKFSQELERELNTPIEDEEEDEE